MQTAGHYSKIPEFGLEFQNFRSPYPLLVISKFGQNQNSENNQNIEIIRISVVQKSTNRFDSKSFLRVINCSTCEFSRWALVSSFCISASKFTPHTHADTTDAHSNILIVPKFRKFHSSDYINTLLAVRFSGLKFVYDNREIRNSMKIPESWNNDASQLRTFLPL